ncbi:MAG: hypothetical protein QOD99_864 [Chthoniobacter sp.]|jgi:spore maturation protein SpmA|nr:hypothetical protein [Chthoniobacter sp.]
MLNYIWLGLVLAAVLLGGWTGRMKELADGTFDSAKTAVTIALGLVGIMALWLGIMRLAERSGLVTIIAGALRPLTRRLFPDVPPEHPASGAIVMTIAANMLGLSNAATPLGLRAMEHLERLNPHPGTATNAMCTFLAISTSSVQLIPATAVAILASAGSKDPTAIIGTALIATMCAAIAGVVSVKWLEKLPMFRVPETVATRAATVGAVETVFTAEEKKDEMPPVGTWGRVALFLFVAMFASWFVMDAFFPGAFGRPVPASASQSVFARAVGTLSLMAIPFLVTLFPLYAALRRVKVYEEFVEGAKEGFNVAVRIIPFLVAILVAVGMFRAAGGIDILSRALAPVFDLMDFPTDLLPMVLVRPLSGSATIGLFTEIVKNHGPDALITRMAGTIFGSTETTFYVIAVYFGSVAVRRTRHAVLAGLTADITGVIVSVIVCRLMFS